MMRSQCHVQQVKNGQRDGQIPATPGVTPSFAAVPQSQIEREGGRCEKNSQEHLRRSFNHRG